MERNKKQVTMNKVLSWFLTICMVIGLMPVNAITAEAADEDLMVISETISDKYQVGGVYLDEEGITVEPTKSAWVWNGNTNTLTFKKSITLNAAATSGYEMAAIGLPAGSTIVVEAGVVVDAHSQNGDGIYCEGALTIRGDGTVRTKGAVVSAATTVPGYLNDDAVTGSGIQCYGGLTIGDETVDEKTVVLVASYNNADKALYVGSDAENLETEEYLIRVNSGQLQLESPGLIDCGSAKKKVKLNSTKVATLIWYSTNADKVTIESEASYAGSYYYSQAGSYWLFQLFAGNGVERSRDKVLVKSDDTDFRMNSIWLGEGIAGEDKVFLGWAEGTDAVSGETAYSMDTDISVIGTIGGDFQVYDMHAVYGTRESITAPTVDYQNAVLDGFVAGATYGFSYIDAEGISYGPYTITASAEGTIAIKGTADDGVTAYDFYGQNVSIIKKGVTTGSDTTYDSVETTVKIEDKEETPVVGVDYTNDTFTGLEDTVQYTILVDGVVYRQHVYGSVVKLKDYYGKKVSFVKESDINSYLNSDPSTELTIAAKPGTPVAGTDFTVTQAVYPDTTKAVIDFTDDTIEYEISTDNGASWITVTDKKDDLEPGVDILVRVKGSDSSPASSAVTVEIDALKEPKPNATISYIDETLIGLTAGADYIVTVTSTSTLYNVIASTDGTIVIDDAWFGKAITIEKVSTADGVANSDKQSMTIDARQTAPVENTDYKVTDAVADMNDGKATITIIGDAGYEYKLGSGLWTAIAKDDTLEVAPTETVLIRKVATADKFTSAETTVDLDAAKEGTPNASVSYAKEVLTGLVAGATYEITDADGTKVTVTADADGNIALEGKDDADADYSLFDTTVSIVKKGANGTSDSDAQTDVVVDARPNAPVKGTDYSVTEAVTGVNDGKATITILDDTKDYEYYDEGADSWKPITDGKLDVEPGTGTEIRVAGDTTTFASESATITTAAAKEGKEATPNAMIDYETECLYGLVSGDAYEITYTPEGGEETTIEVVADADGEIALEDVLEDADETEYCLIGADLSIVKKGVTDGNGDTTQDSDAQSLTVPERPTAPTEEDVVETITVDGTTITIPDGFIADYYDETIYDEENDEYGVYVEVAAGESVTLPAGTEIEVWKTGDADTFESDVLVFNATAKEETPEATINYKDSVVEGLVGGQDYIVKIGDTVIGEGTASEVVPEPIGTLNVNLENIVTGTVISVIKIGDETKYTVDSDSCDITVPTQPSVPNVPIKAENGKDTVTIIEPTDEEGNVTTELEIWDEETDTWVSIGEDGYEVPVETEVFVRVEPTEDTPASLKTSITTPSMEKTPNASVDYAGEGLKDLIAGEKYLVTTKDNVLVVEGTADENGKLAIDNFETYYGKDLLVSKVGKDGVGGTITSAPQTVTVKDSSTVEAPSKGQFTVINGTETTIITGITSDQEYSTDGGNTWHTGDGKDVVIPAGTTILIRDKATEDTPASDPVKIETEVAKTQETTPNASVDYTNEKITGLVANTDYAITVDGVTTTVKSDANGKIDLTNYYGKTIAIVKPGNGTTTTDSAAQQITVASKATTPSADQFVVETPASGDTGNVVIKNVTGDYEYSLDNGAVWLPGTGADLTVPAGTTVLVRRKATTTTPASDSVKIIATTYISSTVIEQSILNTNTDKKDPEGAAFGTIRLKATGKNKAVKLNWKKVPDADGYIIYGAACGSKMKRIKTITGASKKSWTQKKLKKGKYYKYIVSAYKMIDGKEYIIATSISAHAVTNGSKKWGNPIKVKVKSSLTVKKNKTKQIKASYTYKKKVKKHIAILRYESSNPKVATVTKKGKVKGISKGNATIYVYAQNGVYKTVKVKVK